MTTEQREWLDEFCGHDPTVLWMADRFAWEIEWCGEEVEWIRFTTTIGDMAWNPDDLWDGCDGDAERMRADAAEVEVARLRDEVEAWRLAHEHACLDMQTECAARHRAEVEVASLRSEVGRLRKLLSCDHASDCGALAGPVPCDCPWDSAVHRTEEAEAEVARLRTSLAAAQDCGQDAVCAVPPGCQRHWEERARELVRERDAAIAAHRLQAVRLQGAEDRSEYVAAATALDEALAEVES